MDPLLVVISSSASEEDIGLRDKLETQLQSLVRQGLVRVWHAGHVRAGEVTCEVTLKKIREAHILLPLISPDYLGSEGHEHEMKTALTRAAEARVMPILLRPCLLQGTALAAMKLLPDGGAPVTKWTLLDDAWASVERSVLEAAKDLRAGKGHYIPMAVLQTAPMGPPSPPVVESFVPPAVSTVRSVPSARSAVHTAPFTPPPRSDGYVAVGGRSSVVSTAPSVSGPVLPVPSEPHRRASGAPQRAGKARALGLMLSGALVATLGWAGWTLLAQTSTHHASPIDDRSPAPVKTTVVPAPTVHEKHVCCGGVDCPEEERNMTGSWCEKFPTYCIKCISGRKRVEGACADPLPQTARYRIRAGQVLVDNTSVDAAALICMRRSGSSDPETCVTANEARSGKAASVPSPFTVDEITSSPGVDFRIVLGGRDIAKERGAIVHAAGLKVGALCSNVGLRGPASSATVSIYLDDP